MSSIPPVKKGETQQVTIESLSYGGAGVAKIDGFPIFVPGAIPGQKLDVLIVKAKDRYAEGRIEKIVKRSIDETAAKCPHFDACGGCTWQNLTYIKQIAYKEQIVRDTLEHVTPVDDEIRKQLPGRVLKIIPSPQVFNYRNKLELAFGYENMRMEEQPAAEPGKKPKRIYFDENPTIGFYKTGEWSTVVPIGECHLYDEQLPSLIAEVKRFMETLKLPVYNKKTRKGMLRSLLLRRGIHTGEHMICFVVQAKKKELEPLFQHFMKFAGKPGLKSLLIAEHNGMQEKPENPKIHTLVGEPFIRERLHDLTFEISPFSFFQTNTLAAEKLLTAIKDAADINPRDTVLDAYCGMGAIGQYLARYCEKVVGIESHPMAIDDALKSAGKNKIGNISFYKGRTEQVLSNQLRPGTKYNFSVMVLDPPRAGLHPKAINAVLLHRPEKIAYVSCNPATFARDLGQFLKNGYELRSVQPVDMFPHTAHIELVASLQRK